jgi:hypothetical protein
MAIEIDRRIILAVSMVIIALPYIFPFALPLEIDVSTQDSYSVMESMPDGATILFSVDIGLESLAEMQSGLNVLAKYFIDKQFKIVAVSFYTDGPVIFTTYFKPMLEAAGYVDGVDYINLGYISGLSVAYQAAATDIRSAVQTDYYGNPIDGQPIMENVNMATDYAMAVTIDAYNSVNDFITYWGTPFGTPIVGFATGTCFMVYYPNYIGGLCEGLVNGGRGIAEFELLVKKPGLALAGIGAVTVANLMVVLFMILGNVSSYLGRSSGGE